MAGLFFFSPGTASLVRNVVADGVLPGDEDETNTSLLTLIEGVRVWLYPLSARAAMEVSRSQLDVSHRCHGVPLSIDVDLGDVLQHQDVSYTVVLATPSPSGPLGNTGWDLLLKSTR